MSATQPEPEAKEIELKLVFDRSDAAALFAHPLLASAAVPSPRDMMPGYEPNLHPPRAAATTVREPKTRELISVYFDTSDDALRKAGVFLRVRNNGSGYVQTIKTARDEAEFLERDEWECDLANGEPDLGAAEGTALAPLLSEEVRADLQPRFETRFERTIYLVDHEDAEIELAVDQGEITTCDKAAPLCELELELKSGNRAALFSLAKVLAETVPLTLGVKTKAERGFELLEGDDQPFEKSLPVEIAPDQTCAEAFRIVARNCLRQILVNLPATRDGHAEALHQMRVGLRRLRAAVTLFGDVVEGEGCDAISPELKWIGGELGPARDLDVFIADILEPHRAAHPEDPGWGAVYDRIAERRSEAYARAVAATGSPRFRLALLNLGAWLEFGDWAGEGNPIAQQPVAAYGAAKLSQLRRVIEKKGKDLQRLSVTERHRLRIKAKRMRYGSEFFATTFQGKKADKRRKKSLAALEQLQDTLGVLNDIANRQSYLGESSQGPEDARMPVPGIEPGEEKALMKEAKRAFTCFARVKPFWKG